MTRAPTEAMVEAAKYIDRALWQEERLGSDLSGVNWQAVVGLMRGEMLKAKAALAAGPGSVEAQGSVAEHRIKALTEGAYLAAHMADGHSRSRCLSTYNDRDKIMFEASVRSVLNAAPAGEVEG